MKIFYFFLLLFFSSHHPVSLMICIILLTLSLSILISSFTKNSLFSMMLILIMVGGMLILFIYMASMASNETFKFKKSIYFWGIIFILPSFFFEKTLFTQKMSMQIFLSFSICNSIFCICYLLLGLFFIIELITIYKTPLRTNN